MGRNCLGSQLSTKLYIYLASPFSINITCHALYSLPHLHTFGISYLCVNNIVFVLINVTVAKCRLAFVV